MSQDSALNDLYGQHGLHRLLDLQVSTQYLEVGESILRARGEDADGFYRNFGIHRDASGKLPSHVNGEQIRGALQRFIDASLPGRPPSLQFMDHFPITAHGQLGMLMLTIGTLGEAFDAALQYGSVLMPAFSSQRQDIGDEAHFVIAHRYDFGMVGDFLMELMMITWFKLLPFLARQPDTIRIQLAHAAPPHAEAFAASLRGHFQFGCAHNQLIIARAELRIPTLAPSPTNSSQLRSSLEQQAKQQADARPFTQRVRRLLKKALDERRDMSAEQLAEALSLSPRTLNRRLQAEDTTIPQIFNQLRIEYASLLLRESQKTIAEIGYMAGFSDLARFSRVFKQITGQSPSDFRGGRPRI